jgi:transposase
LRFRVEREDSTKIVDHEVGARDHVVGKALYMATIVAMRWNPVIHAYYNRLCSAGKKKMVALIAAMHKLLTIFNFMIKNQEDWKPKIA